MSCNSAVVSTACPPCAGQSCPKPAGVANTLGFSNVPSCCRFPCPKFPFHSVKICFKINRQTCLQIAQGCLTAPEVCEGTGPAEICECPVDYTNVLTQDSWGRGCRVVQWERQVPTGTFIRLRLCACDPCAAECDDGFSGVIGGAPVNGLLKFEVDGVDYVNFLQNNVRFATSPGQYQCFRAWCTSLNGATADGCCEGAQRSIRWDTITGPLPWGTEIVFGPIGEAIV